MHKRIVNGVTVDDTELYEQIEYWKNKYEERCNEISNEIHNDIRCDKCNGKMKYIEQFNTYICMTCGHMK